MKKSIIAAGAASVALAAMPVVGVFAIDNTSQTDYLRISINSVCSFGHSDDTADPEISVPAPSHADGDGSWGDGTGTPSAGDEADPDTLSKTMAPGTYTESLGTTVLAVYCNNSNGYVITTSEAAALTNTTSDTIPISGTISAAASAWSYKVATGASIGGTPVSNTQRGSVMNGHTAWAVPNATPAVENTPYANGVIAGYTTGSKVTDNSGDYYTVTYGASVNNTQAAGTYTGHITYTLGQPS